MTNAEILEALDKAGMVAGAGPAPVSIMLFERWAEAELLYGPRDASWQFGGINFVPKSAGPSVKSAKDGRRVMVLCLTEDVFGDWEILRWQLAHEVIHLLGPSTEELTTVFEEGLASYEQFRTNVSHYNGVALFPDAYQRAFELIKPLVEAHPTGVRELRAENGSLSPLNAKLIIKHFPSAGVTEANSLSESFRFPKV